MTVDDVVTRLDAKKNGVGYMAKCPAHPDGTASLKINSGDNGKVLLHCYAGCKVEDICDAAGFKLADLFAEKQHGKQRITVADLAAHKKFEADFLRRLGLHDLDRGGVGIPYPDCDGNVVSVKGRGSLVAKESSWWVQGKPLAYGLDRLVVARELDYLVLVEGESDCWVLWHAEIPALGVPGADLTKVIAPNLLDGIQKVYAIREPDKGGDTFIAGLTKQLGANRFTEVRLDGAKDPAELYAKDPATFKARFSAALEKAKPSVDSSTFNLIAVRDIPEIVTQEWLIKGLVPRFPDDGTAGYIFAPAKFRKSMVLADWALSVTSGTPALGRFEVQHTGSVVGFFAEDPKGETSRRIHRMARARGIDVPANLHLIDTPAIAIDSAEHQEKLLKTLTAIPDLAMAWFDPMVRLHRVNDNRAEELGPIHTFLRTLARSCPGAVFVFAHHTNGEGGARGSTDYPAFGDFNIYGRKKNATTAEVTSIDNRGGPPGAPFTFTIEDGFIEGAGATLKLVVGDVEEVDDKHATAVEQNIIAFRATNPGASGRACKEHFKTLGIKVGNDLFWEIWKASR